MRPEGRGDVVRSGSDGCPLDVSARFGPAIWGSWSILRPMRFRKRRGVTHALVLACHPVPTLALTVGLAVAAALSGRSGQEVLLVAATVLSGQLTVGWVNDLVDRERDRQVGRQDKPVAQGWVDPGTVSFAVACAVLVVIPLSMANGTAAGLAHLAAVLSLWMYSFYFKRTPFSW